MKSVHLPQPELMIDAYPHQLSGGQRQRIMIAAALIMDPALIIADEPTTALDVTTQAQILKLIKEMQGRRQTGVLFITHDFGVVSEIADRVIVMQYGRIVEQGTREQVLSNPREAYTQMLVAAVPSLVPPRRATVTGPVALATRGLSKIFGSRSIWRSGRVVKAAQDVSVDIRKGETLGIVGESGSGKTTVARCIARLIEPSAGQILIGSTDVAHLPERAAAPASAQHPDRVSGPVPLAQSTPHGGARHHRGAGELRRDGGSGFREGALADGAGRVVARRARPLSASVLGRTAPAHLHRPGAGHGADTADRG